MGKTETTRRQMLAASVGLVAGLGTVPRPAFSSKRLDFTSPADSLYGVVKLRGDLAPARVLQWYTGTLALLLPGRMPEPVASYQGVIRTDWTPLEDGAYSYRTFDLGYFGDLETGRPAASLRNPITGDTVQPTLIEDGPIERIYSIRGIYDPKRAAPGAGKKLTIPWQFAGDNVWYQAAFGFRYNNPLPPSKYPELSSTEQVMQRSQFIYRGKLSDLEDETRTRAPGETVMLVVSTIHPWLKMGAYGGFQQIQTVSQKIHSINDVSEAYRQFLHQVRPDFLTEETPFVGVGNSFERYKQERLGG